MVTFLHNPRCSKSRQALKIITGYGLDFEIREYLNDPLSLEELKNLKNKLNLNVIDFTRTNEQEFKESGLNKNSNELFILELISNFPKIMQRPIILNQRSAFVCRPPENVLNILESNK